MTTSDEIVRFHKTEWDRKYAGAPRQRYPDLMFIHFLMRYAAKTPISNALVIGCGDGSEVFAIARLGAAVTGIDISSEATQRTLEFARDEGLREAVATMVCDQRVLKFPNSSFDLVVSWSVISYLSVEDAAKALSEIHRVLRPNGSFIGLLESNDHSGPKQTGVIQIGPRTWRMPSQSKTAGDVILTYFSRDDADRALSDFRDVSLSHRVVELPPDSTFRVGQWMFHCRK